MAVVIALGAGLAVDAFRHRASVASAGREYATATGQRLSLTLVDGTHLTLAPASTIRVVADYGRGAREVTLDGEAYFAVTHDAAHPFAVRVRGAVVQDVGTAFDVRAYREDSATRIAVAEGAVAVDTPAQQVKAGDVATVTDRGVTIRHGTDISALLAWMQGGLVFQDTPLRDVIKDLARAFDVDITVADSALLSQHITSSFGDEPVDNVLGAVAVAVGARYERAGRKVVMRRQTSGAGHPGARGPEPTMSTARVDTPHE